MTTTSTIETGRSAEDRELLKLAQRYTDAINRDNATTVAELTCGKAAPGLLQITANGRTVRLTGQIDRSPGQERAYVHLTIGGSAGPNMTIEQRDGTWCIRD